VNPAAMIRVKQKSFFAISPMLLNPQSTYKLGKSLGDLAQGNTNTFGTAADTLSRQKGTIALGMELREFPLSFAWVANGFGFGLWNRTFVNANIVDLGIEAKVYSDVMLPIGFAFKILNLGGHSLDAGVTLKPFVRTMAWEREDIINLLGNNSDFIDNFNIPVIAGGSVDAGLLYRWGGFSAGFTFQDIYSRGEVVYNINDNYKDTNSYHFPFTMNAGIAYQFTLFNILGFALAADWRDIRNFFQQDNYLHRNYLLDFGAGFQLSLFDVIRLRVGMSEMLPACGLGFDLGPLKIDAAYYGREFGNEPGQLSAAAVSISIAIRPDAQKRDWPWARHAIIGQ